MKALRTVRALGVCALTGIFFAPSIGAAAEQALPNKPLVCAATEVAQCPENEACVQGSASLFNLPVLLRIKFKEKVVESVLEGGERRTSRIQKVEPIADALVLQGTDEGMAWIGTIQRANGRMTITSAREGVGFVVFGACSTL